MDDDTGDDGPVRRERVRVALDAFDRGYAKWHRQVGVALVCVAIYGLCRSIQEQGHTWGDDFALYVDQARGLVDGSVNDVLALNRYGVDNSAYHTFSPYAYPWMLPLLLAPVIALKGLDWSALKMIPTLCFVVGLFFFHRVLRHRIGEAGAMIVMLAVGLNSIYIGYTGAVLSDLTFFMWVMITMWWIDRAVHGRWLLGSRTRPLVVLGLLVGAAFNTRREGAVLLAGLLAAQCVEAVALWRGRDRRTAAGAATAERDLWRSRLRAAITPYLSFAAVVVVVQLLLPTVLFPKYDSAGGSGRKNMVFNMKWYRKPLAEFLGLKDLGPVPVRLLDSNDLGDKVFWAFVVLTLFGVAWRVLFHIRRDVHLVIAFAALTLAVLSPPFRENRYLMALLPFALYFAWQGVNAVQTLLVGAWGSLRPRGRRRRLPPLVANVCLLGLVVCIASDTWNSYEYHRDYDYVEWGPADPVVLEAFAAVEQFTDGRDVVAFFQARTMNLITRRKAVQGNSETMLRQRADWYLMVRDSDYIQTNLTDARAAELGFQRMWENSRFILWRIPERYRELPTPELE